MIIFEPGEKQTREGGPLLAVSVGLSIILGTFLQVGKNIYLSNVVIKIFGILLPITIALCILAVRDKNFKLGLSKRFVAWFFIVVLYVVYLVVETSNFGRLFLGTADRNLGLVSWGLAALAFMAGLVLRRSQRHWILVVIVLTAASQSVVVGYQKFLEADVLSSDGTFQPAQPIYGTFYNSNPLSFFLGITSSGLLAFILFSNWRAKQTFVFAFLLILSLFGLFWSASAQGLIGFVAVGGLVAFQRAVPALQRNFSTLMILVYLSGLSLFCWVILRTPLTSDSRISSNPFLERLEIYKAALLMFSKNIWTGVGMDRFGSDYGKYTISTDLKLVDNAHSIPLQVLSTLGLIGLLLMLSMIVWLLHLKHNESLCSKSEWSFWQAMFFSSVLIGIIGIEHPVVITLTFLSAGILRGSSLIKTPTKDKVIVSLSSRSFYSMTLAFTICLISLLFYFTQSELRVANKLTQLAERTISGSEFDIYVQSEYQDIYNARLLLTTGQAYIAIENRLGAENVAKLMLSRFPDDQRTSILFFAIADKWVDEEALKVAIKLRDGLFPTVKSGDNSSP